MEIIHFRNPPESIQKAFPIVQYLMLILLEFQTVRIFVSSSLFCMGINVKNLNVNLDTREQEAVTGPRTDTCSTPSHLGWQSVRVKVKFFSCHDTTIKQLPIRSVILLYFIQTWYIWVQVKSVKSNRTWPL